LNIHDLGERLMTFWWTL